MQVVVGNTRLLTLRYSPLVIHASFEEKKLLYSLIIHLESDWSRGIWRMVVICI